MKENKNQQYTSNVESFYSGLHTDNDFVNQPKNTYRFALNAINESKEGQHNSISVERANIATTLLPSGFYIIGSKYIGDDESALILINPTTGYHQIGLLSKNSVYTTIVNTRILNLQLNKQCDIIYRIRGSNEKVIYWVDGLNRPRTFNFNKPYNFYTDQYQSYLNAGGNPSSYMGEKWDSSSFDLIKSYSSIPTFNNIQIIDTGSILPGSYNFAIQYVDSDLNPTEWITTSNTVNIYNDSINNSFEKIRGSKNIDTLSQSFPRANKSVKLTIGNLDNNFPYYRVAIIQATSTDGTISKVLASELYPTSESNFVYTGNDSSLTSLSIGDILIDKETILAPEHIEQLENRLVLASTQGKGIDWCEFQKYASKISADLVTKQIILNNELSEPNVKNPKSTFMYRGYMPGEVYSFGINYIFKDGSISPTVHIPGKSPLDTTSLMKVYEGNSKYLDIHNCTTNGYWGKDSLGDTLLGKNIRHHRFPFRKDVNKPLFTRDTSITNINQYVLKLDITLNPAWVSSTGAANLYPVDSTGNPLSINYDIEYKINGSTSNTIYSGNIVDSDIGNPITVYQDITPLDYVVGTDYYRLISNTDLWSYQDPTGSNYYLVPRFIITPSYTYGILASESNTDKSEIFGIKFSNIEKPHPDVIGFYIVRNERNPDDKIILDNALFGPNISYNQYKSFGLIMPKQIDTKLTYNNKSVWFYNPSFQYFGDKTDFNSVEVEGIYNEDVVSLPTYVIANGKGASGLGIYINDVQAGTSYNPDVNKKKDRDDDGFDLVIGYRNTTLTYQPNTVLTFPTKDRVFYLTAASSQNYLGDTFYNVSVDNKIGFLTSNDTFDTSYFYNTTSGKNGLVYGSLVKNQPNAYSNFINREYYKEHNNPIMFGNNNIINNVEIYNGDAQISSFNFVSSVYYDMVTAARAKKSKVWQIVVGAILVIAAVVATVLTGGAATPLIAAALSYGVSLAASGLKFEQFKNMIDVDYSKGLRETITDLGILYTIAGSVSIGPYNFTRLTGDDTIRWFSDRVSNIYIESSVPFGLRSGLTCGVPDFIDAPTQYNEDVFRNYLTEKLTLIDRDQGSGRLYKGYATAEFYDMNKDYLRFNKEKVFIHLPIEYDCCNDKYERFPNRLWYSQQSFQEEKTDNYSTFLPNNYRDIEGEHGNITDLYRLGNALFIHTKEGLWHLPQNMQERVTNEIVTFVGTGEFFNVPPRKVIDDSLGGGGSQHKWSTIKTKNGVIFINELENKIYIHNDKVLDISIKGMKNWFENNLKPNLTKQLFDNFNVTFENYNNPANFNGIGYLSAYDTRHERFILTKRDYLILPNKLSELVITNVIPLDNDNIFRFCTLNSLFYKGNQLLSLDDITYFENKSWTISYSFYTNSWVSFHSYIPNYYIYTQNNLYSFICTQNKIWKHNIDNFYQSFYERHYPHILEYVSVNSPLVDTITEDFTLQTKALRYDNNTNNYVEERFITFNRATFFNTRQCSGRLTLNVKENQTSNDWYENQIVNSQNSAILERKERDWHINDFRDYVVDYTIPFFSKSWNDIKFNYYIDKTINNNAINFNKNWYELESFKDKFIAVRLEFDTFDNINLTTNFSIETKHESA